MELLPTSVLLGRVDDTGPTIGACWLGEWLEIESQMCTAYKQWNMLRGVVPTSDNSLAVGWHKV